MMTTTTDDDVDSVTVVSICAFAGSTNRRRMDLGLPRQPMSAAYVGRSVGWLVRASVDSQSFLILRPRARLKNRVN